MRRSRICCSVFLMALVVGLASGWHVYDWGFRRPHWARQTQPPPIATSGGRNDGRIDDVSLKNADSFDASRFKKLLVPILKERVSGTAANVEVRDYIVNELNKAGGWSVELDTFREHVAGDKNRDKVTFSNVVATRQVAAANPSAVSSRLLLACHFDSKWYPNMEFIGAIDSAAPCAMLLNTAHDLSAFLRRYDSSLLSKGVTIDLVFFDGEEAFLSWTSKDSIYGARHLAKKWEAESRLHEIDAFVLLDLIGYKNTQISSIFKSTHDEYQRLQKAEEELADSRRLYNFAGRKQIFHSQRQPYGNQNRVEDDHVPFLQRGVPILHLIPLQFPSVWHTTNDNANALHDETMYNWSMILDVFVSDYVLDAVSNLSG